MTEAELNKILEKFAVDYIVQEKFSNHHYAKIFAVSVAANVVVYAGLTVTSGYLLAKMTKKVFKKVIDNLDTLADNLAASNIEVKVEPNDDTDVIDIKEKENVEL